MQDYLEGFNDGYKKALEQMGKPQLEVTMDGRELAKLIYEDVTELQEKKRRIEEAIGRR